MIATDVMRTNFEFVTTKYSVRKLAQMLKRTNFSTYPLVEDSESMKFIGQIKRSHLVQALEDKVKNHMSLDQEERATQGIIIEGAQILEENEAHLSTQDTLVSNISLRCEQPDTHM